jgi:hypothetical protein
MTAAIPEAAVRRRATKRATKAAATRQSRTTPIPQRIQTRARNNARQAAVDAPFNYARQAREVGGGASVAPGNRNYQAVILAEFLAAVVILTVVPIASGGSPNAQAKGSPSPYDTGDLRQLAAVGMVYFVLALLSSGNSGRLSAWFGGLVLVVLALGKVAQGEISAVTTNLTPPKDDAGAE